MYNHHLGLLLYREIVQSVLMTIVRLERRNVYMYVVKVIEDVQEFGCNGLHALHLPLPMVIYKELEMGRGIDKCVGGRVNIGKPKYTIKQKKYTESGGVVFQLGSLYLPPRGV